MTTVNPYSSASSSYTAGQSREIKSAMDKDDFLKLYIEQLKNQDPLEPMDTNEMAAQFSQFTTVEQLMNMNSSMEEMLSLQLGNAVSYIGFEVTYSHAYQDDQGNQLTEERTGIVQSISHENGSVVLKMMDGSEADISRIISVALPGTESA
ncbi:MAG: flagellar hook capping FlgD N-terminal domain-containing protein [Synergistota bacterium]|nr:flagellar hook capping FlgD N-terminal domain-containing protein [Synergistota bacterium]